VSLTTGRGIIEVVRAEAAGFSKVAQHYERGRPEYPLAAVTWIVTRTGLGPGKVVVDLAAGTGKLTRQLVHSGARVIAVEPVAEMLAELRAVLPDVEAITGTAEATGLPDAVASVVTVAQAFHWFATPSALEEIARVLEPAGHLVLVWNHRELTQPLQAELTRILASSRRDTPTFESGEWNRLMEKTPLFAKADEHHVPVTQVLDLEGLIDRVVSTSYIANLPPGERASVLQQVRDLVTGSEVELAYDCQIYVFRRS
jgi:ubiquinone/menaquinone biosynthesis C-methylase UbiE